MCSTIKACEKRLELAKKACIIALSNLERVWNPDGLNDTHLYEDIRDALVKPYLAKIHEAERLLSRALAPNECKTM